MFYFKGKLNVAEIQHDNPTTNVAAVGHHT